MKNKFFKRFIAVLITSAISLSYLTMIPISEIIAESENTGWKEAYADFLKNGEYSNYVQSWTDTSSPQFMTIYVDDNDIPELVISFASSHAMGSILLTYQNDKVIPLSFKGYDDSVYYTCGSNGGIYYKERGNVFNSSYYGMGDFGDNIYSIENGTAVIQCKLMSEDHDENRQPVTDENGNIKYFYFIDDVEVNEEEYQQKYNYYEINSMQFIGYDNGLVSLTDSNIKTYLYDLPESSVQEQENLKNSGMCGDNAYWNFDESTGTLTISGTGSVNSGSWSASDGAVYVDENGYCNIKRIIIEEGITELHRDFLTVFGTGVESISFPNTLTYIDDWYFAFMNDIGIYNGTFALKEVIIPKSVMYIGEHAFNSQFCGDGSVFEYYDDFIIKGYTGSAAQTYANENNIKFVALDADDFEEIPEVDNSYENYFIKQHLTNHFEENGVWYRSYNSKSAGSLNDTFELAELDVKCGALCSNIMLDKGKAFFDLNTAELFTNPIDTQSIYFTLLSKFVSEFYDEETMTTSLAESLRYTLTEINAKLLDEGSTRLGISYDSLNFIIDMIDIINESRTFVELSGILDEAGDYLDALGIANDIVQGVFEGYKSIKEYLEYTAYYRMFVSLDNSVHETFLLIRDNTDDKELIAVLDEYINVLEATDKEKYISQLCTLHTIDSVEEATTKTVYAIRGDIANMMISKALSAIPGAKIILVVWEGAKLIVTVEDFVADHLMHTDEYYETFAALIACNVVHRALYKGYNEYMEIFKNNQTMENASVIHIINRCYISTDILAIENANRYLKLFSQNNMMMYGNLVGIAAHDILELEGLDTLNPESILSSIQCIYWGFDTLLEDYSESNCCMSEEFWKMKIATEHYFNETLPEQWNNLTDEVVKAWNQKRNELLEKWKSNIDVIFISCPVSVKVYDENNQMIAYLSDSEIDVNPMYSHFFFVCDETDEQYQSGKVDYTIESTKGKILILPQDSKDYHYEIIVTDNGTMNIISYYVDDISDSNWFDSEKINYSFDNVVVTNSSSFVIEQENDKYSLVNLSDNNYNTTENNNILDNSNKYILNIGIAFTVLLIVICVAVFLKKRNKK